MSPTRTSIFSRTNSLLRWRRSGSPPLKTCNRYWTGNFPPADPNELADRWVVELDRYGLSRAALIASIPGDEASVTAAVTRHPDRFYGFFMLNPTLASPETYVASALSNGLIQGICLFPAMHRFSVQDTRRNTW
jgi:hypothetical protein